jgi:hypothetical protein
LPGDIPHVLSRAIATALSTGILTSIPGEENCGTTRIGENHGRTARGYITIDVVSNCTVRAPDDPNYYRTDLLYDNVLLGEYQYVSGEGIDGNFAQGNSMVHIRAVPEGGRAGSTPGTNLPYTFYDRYTLETLRTMDRRQPLPSVFAARWIEGGLGNFNAVYGIWREGLSTGAQECSDASVNAELPNAEIIRFDERENSFAYAGSPLCSPCAPEPPPTLPASSQTETDDPQFPANTGADVGGWMYLNLNNGGSRSYSAARTGFAPPASATLVRPSQNWVTVSMYASGRYGVATDAAMLGNGCTPAALPSTARKLGPAENATP